MVAAMAASGVGFTAHAAETRAANPSQLEGRKEVALVDTSVKDYQDLARDIGAGIGIVEFDGSKDGLAQIAQWAATASGYDAIHILSHGSAGVVRLGTAVLTQESLADATTQAELSALGRALVTGGDVLLYSCDVASGISGRAFVKSLSATMGVDVAASSDATGDAAQGGNWVLEYQTGAIETAKLTVRGYPHLLASTTFDFESVAPASSKTITQTIGSDTMVITSTDSNMLVDSESNAFRFDVPDASGNVMATGEGGFYTESRLVLTMSGGKTFDLTSFTLAQVGGDGATITLTTSKGSETFTANSVGNSRVLNLSTAVHPGYFVGVSSVVITTADSGGVFEWGFDNIVLSNIVGPPSTIVVTAALSQDSGQSSSDFITNVAAQTISGTLSANLLAGESVQVSFDNGSTWSNATSAVGSSTWSTNATLAGSNTFQARVTNANGSSTAYTHTYTLDTTAPSITFSNLGLSADTGLSATDFITNAASQTISATLSSTLALGDVVYGSLDGGATWFDVSSKVSSTTLAWSGATLANGTNNLSFRVTDAAGNVGPVANQSYMLDTTAPAVTSVALPPNATYYAGDSLDFTVNFNESVHADTSGGTPRIAIVVGATTRYATYVSGSGTSALVFRYTVVNGDVDANGITVGTLNANGGTLSDLAGNNAVLTLNGLGSTAGVLVDGSQPSITSVSSSNANGSYGAGQAISITVGFSSAVVVDTSGGTPTLALNSGGTAAYASGSGTSTLTFSYTVAAGHNSADLDYSSTGALVLNGATIKDSGGIHVNALLQLSAPGAAGSLGANKNIVIDTTAPTTTVATAAFSADTGASSTDLITKVAAQTVSGTLSANLASGETVQVSLDNGATWATATASVGSNVWSLSGVTLTGSNTLKARVSDAASNSGAVWSSAYVLDTTAPTVPTVNALVATSTTPTLTGTATLAAGETLTVSVGGATYAVVPTGGNWSLNLASATPASGTLALTYSSTHSVTATATDLAGNASTDTTTNELVIGAAPTAPAAPSFTSVTAGDRSVSLVWSAPASNGSPITGYQVTGTPSGSCSTTGATSCTVTGLTNGTSYTFTMTATNSVGTSAPSAASSAVIPRLLTVSGSAPDMPGTATATLSGGGASCTLDPTSGFASLSNPAPAGKTMLYGEYAFQASGCTASVTMTLEYPQPLPPGVQFWKYGPATVGATSSTWFPLAGVTLSADRKTVSYTITDNGVGDSDPVAGAIRDPFALVAGPVVSDPASIPVDAPWALGLLSAALGALGWRRQRRLARRC